MQRVIRLWSLAILLTSYTYTVEKRILKDGIKNAERNKKIKELFNRVSQEVINNSELSYGPENMFTKDSNVCYLCLENRGSNPITLSCHFTHKFHALCIQNYTAKKYPYVPYFECPLCYKKLNASEVVD